MSTTLLDTRLLDSLRSAHQTLARRGELLSPERLAASYGAFRAQFGPDRLGALDGNALLQAMHTHGNKESLVYWLEFKNDDEFPGPQFGSISGGSAHKFRIFRRQPGDQWVKGNPHNEQNITEDEAVEIARTHRNQLLAGVALLEKLPASAGDPDYLALQNALEKEAPDISNLAWAHKYWCLLFPEGLDDYHSQPWQRYHLLRLLQTPPDQDGLYVCAGRFAEISRQLGWPMNQLTAALNERNGAPKRYWRVGTRLGEGPFIWPEMRDGGYAAIGWELLGDLSSIAIDDNVKDAVRPVLEKHYPNDAKTLSRKAGEIRDFIARMQEGDVIVAGDGGRVLGVGVVSGPYRHENTEPVGAPHRRPVDWVSTQEWQMPTPEGLRTTFFGIGRHTDNVIEIERRRLDGSATPTPPSKEPRSLGGIPGRIQAILERKGQAIVYGPPGTGKTYWARLAALDLAALGAFGRPYAGLSDGELDTVQGTAQTAGLVRCCTFHPAYGYEDFIEGFRPRQGSSGQLVFTQSAGIFKTLCEDAQRAPQRKFFLLIDEINRGDIPRIFGELLTLLEKDKRGLGVSLALSGDRFAVPPNVQVLGTMNTADRSIALLDTALRRRFGFVELMPDVSVLGAASAGGSIPLGPWLLALNDRIRAHLGRDARNLQIGHAYLLEAGKPVTDFARFVRILGEDLVPLLEEYCYEDYGALARILGPGFVDEPRQRIREELFASAKWPELIQALLEPAPEIVTAPDAGAAAESEDGSDAEEAEA